LTLQSLYQLLVSPVYSFAARSLPVSFSRRTISQLSHHASHTLVREVAHQVTYGVRFVHTIGIGEDEDLAARPFDRFVLAGSSGSSLAEIKQQITSRPKGADLLIIDDPHSEQEAKQNNPAVYDGVYEWYTSGPRQRLQPGGAIVVVMTRWALRDLTGQVMKAAAARGGEQWDVIEFPAILPSGKPLWPEFWSLEELEALREELPNSKWQAQYQQTATIAP
jgi:hypothetical protein